MIVKLGTVISEYSVRNRLDEDIPVYSVTNERGFCTGYFSKDVSSKDRTTYKIVPKGYFAYNPSRINVGSIDWQHCEERVIVSPLYVVFGVDKSVDRQYLLHSRFVELFGDPMNGTAKYPVHKVGEIADSVDPQPSHRTPPIEKDGIPYVSIKDCDYKTGKIDFEGARRVSRKVLEEHLNRYTLHEGDFIIGKIGTIGKPIFVPARDDYTLSANIVLVQPDSKQVSPYFLKYSFESDFVESQFLEAQNSTSQAAFGIQKVRTIEVMNPDIEVQREFERFVKRVDKSKYCSQKFAALCSELIKIYEQEWMSCQTLRF